MLEALMNAKANVSVTLAPKAGAQGASLRDRILQNLTDKVEKVVRDEQNAGLEMQIKRLREALEQDQLQISRTYIESVRVVIKGKVDGMSCEIPLSFVPQGR